MTITDFFSTTSQLKEFIRGIDINTNISSFTPVYRQAAKKYINLVGQATYDALKGFVTTPPEPANEDITLAIEYTRAAIANLLAMPWFVFDSGERNATDKKLYRYQENAWAELDQLVALMESLPETFTDFADSDLYAQREGLFLSNAGEFNKYYGIDDSSYFYYSVVYIMHEVENAHILPRFDELPDEEDDTPDLDLLYAIKKFIAFETVAIACQRFDYTELPRGIRNEIIKEIGASVNRAEMGNIKDAIYSRLHAKAMSYLETIDISIAASGDTTPVVPTENVNAEENKFYLSI
jgi:hypothetical protein